MYDIVPWVGEVVAVVLAIMILVFATLLCVAGPRTPKVHPVANVPNQAADRNVLTVEILSSELQSVSNWYQLGINLDLETHNLDNIQQNYAHQEVDQQRLEMLDLWLRRKLNDTWEDVVSALQQMGENRVAESIRQKYIRGRSKFSRLYSALARWFTTDSGPRSSEFRFARQYRSLRHNSNNKT